MRFHESEDQWWHWRMTPRWVTKDRYCELTGLSEAAVRARIDSRKWTRGVHYVVDGRVTMINLREVNKWWDDREACDRTEPAEKLKSAGGTAVTTIGKRSTLSLRKLV
jgi:hypothetical protein